MDSEYFFDLIEKLTGKPVRPSKEEEGKRFLIEKELLKPLFSRKNLRFNCNEFNELLLICNKERITEGFFDFFFRKSQTKKEILTIKEIEEGIDVFRFYAMLVYGNFIYAYRELSACSFENIKEHLKLYLINTKIKEDGIKKRPPPLDKLNEIKKEDTHFTGYITGPIVKKEYEAAEILNEFASGWRGNIDSLLKDLDKYIKQNSDDIKHIIMQAAVKYKNKYKKRLTKDGFKKFAEDSFKTLVKVKAKCDEILKTAQMNTYTYLTWDYMDVYLATSMREKYDFESFSKFVKDLFSNKHLRNLKLRYFDPTQSDNVENRIDKGLIEGLMLKRAECTIYSIQEADTLGKDSELASTLAQGKPVIAYIPDINKNIKKHVKFVKSQSPVFLRNKLDLLISYFRKPNVQEKCREWLRKQEISLTLDNPIDFMNYVCNVSSKISEISYSNIWESVDFKKVELNAMKQKLGKDFEIICNFIAITDGIFYDRRAKLIKDEHPLGVQINLSTGVANGVLLVRDINTCAKLLYSFITNKIYDIITNDSGFNLKLNKKDNYWYLEEKLSGCVYRVVTKDAKLTNSFWNLYFVPKEKGEQNG